jgi:DNA-binding transcriptional LysR family regulator
MVMARSEAWAGRRLRLRDLDILMTVAREGGMAKAARRLSMSQPAVSKAIADLEANLGLKLFDRGAQGVRPTLYGEALLQRSIAAFDELHQALSDLDYLSHRTAGEVRMGCNESLAAALLPAVVRGLNVSHPGLTLHVTQMSRPITEEARRLREREVELIVARGVFSVPENDLDLEVLFEEPLLLIAGAASRWAKTPPRSLEDLVEAPWVLYPPGEPPGTLVDEAFRARGLPPPTRGVTTSSFYLRQQLLEGGDYVTVAPRCMLAVFNAREPLVAPLPVDLGISLRPVAIYTLRNRTLSPLAAVVMDGLRAAAGQVGSTPAGAG